MAFSSRVKELELVSSSLLLGSSSVFFQCHGVTAGLLARARHLLLRYHQNVVQGLAAIRFFIGRIGPISRRRQHGSNGKSHSRWGRSSRGPTSRWPSEVHIERRGLARVGQVAMRAVCRSRGFKVEPQGHVRFGVQAPLPSQPWGRPLHSGKVLSSPGASRRVT